MSFSAATHGKYILGVSLKQRELQAGRDLSQKPGNANFSLLCSFLLRPETLRDNGGKL